MDRYLELDHEDRRLLCEQARAELGLAAESIEKDFWVCWTLRELFALAGWGQCLTFKGGTSLSKGWKLIERFSEDIDVTIDREFLGFAAEHHSNKQIKKLKEESRRRIAAELLPALRKQMQERLSDRESWTLETADVEVDPDLQTLMFEYPKEFSYHGYVKPVVKIELGARGEAEPSEMPRIQPLLAESHPTVLADARFSLRTLVPRRTFWEKAMMLHEETYRPAGKARKPRMSRHYYDLWCLIRKGVAAEASQDQRLFERVAAHRQRFFRYSWMDYTTLKKGLLRLVPLTGQETEWRRDYAAMSGEMFFGEQPTFHEVLKIVKHFEMEFNE
ncbi:MAG TPA: nucleotidyl transferase AbiEii/AbiGii toxin family protein [Blastocatellia bacterium]|nr:nucleotidyl transferase AbiEii/AbiGii toxin family protein [Blastocatellia bacterium]